jgi:hypothetical protein
MEALLVWWNLQWEGPERMPVYTMQMPSSRVCTMFAYQLAQETGRELLGHFNALSHTCRIVIFPERIE